MNWAQKHSAIFGYRSEDWTNTYRMWGSLWAAEGYSPQDLDAAVTVVARRKRLPNYASEHFSAIGEELRESKVRAMQIRVASAPIDRGTCIFCQNHGLIVVPHSNSYDENGVWTRINPPHQGYTMAVACDRCPIAAHRKLRGMPFSEYQVDHPDWREQMAQWDQILKERTKVAAFNHHNPLAGLVNKLTDRFKLGQNNG